MCSLGSARPARRQGRTTAKRPRGDKIEKQAVAPSYLVNPKVDGLDNRSLLHVAPTRIRDRAIAQLTHMIEANIADYLCDELRAIVLDEVKNNT